MSLKWHKRVGDGVLHSSFPHTFHPMKALTLNQKPVKPLHPHENIDKVCHYNVFVTGYYCNSESTSTLWAMPLLRKKEKTENSCFFFHLPLFFFQVSTLLGIQLGHPPLHPGSARWSAKLSSFLSDKPVAQHITHTL